MPIDNLQSTTTDPPSGIHINSLSHEFGRNESRVLALDNITLDIAEGEFVSLVGASGCGKTTLLDIMSGLLAPQSGTVLLGDTEPLAGRQDTARMFARDALLPWLTAAQNIGFSLATRNVTREHREEMIMQLLREVQLEEFADAYPAQLSQGMRQRVALARTFSLKSKFVLLDEPFGALDAMTKINLQDQLVALWEGTRSTTVVLVTHDLGEAVALSDRIFVLSSRPGKIIANIPISLPRPRNVKELQSLPEYHELVASLWEKLSQ